MNVLYVRTSSQGQNTSRQKIEREKYDWIIEDKISGATPFFERPGGAEVYKLLEKKRMSKLTVHSIDRMFRDAKDMMITLEVFNEKKTPVHFISQGLTSLNENLEKDPIVSMIIHITGIFSQLTRENIKIAQAQGISAARKLGKYHGRKRGSSESVQKFLNKPKNSKALELLEKNYKGVEVSKIVGLSLNTITKIKKLGRL